MLTFDDKHKLKIGNYCSIAPDVAFMLSADHPTDLLSTYPYKVKLLNQPLEVFQRVILLLGMMCGLDSGRPLCRVCISGKEQLLPQGRL